MDDLARLDLATADLEPPFAVVDMGALWSNAADMTRRAQGTPIRLATKSLRCRGLQDRVLEREGFRGALAFTLPEALWLAHHGYDDIVVGYPTADRIALQELSAGPSGAVTIMIDSVEHLDLIDSVLPRDRDPIRVCIDVDAGLWLAGGKVKVGVKRSPVHDAGAAVELARTIAERPGFTLVGLMAYEAQVAGVGDAPSGQPLRARAIRTMQSRSIAELRVRRAEVVARVREVAPLEFVNGGGTGSLEQTAAEDVVTEIAAGSGLYGPALFDTYSRFRPAPAAMFALSVVRRPGPGMVTVLGGGYIASGSPDRSRLPEPYLPEGLRLDRMEGAGEVQTPVLGDAADRLRVGDRVYFRHAKAGELCERFPVLYLVEGDRITEAVPTYRGEGRAFL